MKKLYFTKTFLLFVLFIVSPNPSTFPQSNIKKGVKFGIEIKNYFNNDIGAFNKTFGFAFGVFTGIQIYSFDEGTFLLKTELNFIKLQYYNPGKTYTGVDTSAFNWNGSNYTVIDEKFTFGVLEFALLPAYHLTLDKNNSIDVFIGPGFGLGGKGLEIIHRDKNKLTYDPNDEYTMGFVQSASLILGGSLYYKPIVIDVRYKYDYLNGTSKVNNLTNFYVQVGFAL